MKKNFLLPPPTCHLSFSHLSFISVSFPQCLFHSLPLLLGLCFPFSLPPRCLSFLSSVPLFPTCPPLLTFFYSLHSSSVYFTFLRLIQIFVSFNPPLTLLTFFLFHFTLLPSVISSCLFLSHLTPSFLLSFSFVHSPPFSPFFPIKHVSWHFFPPNLCENNPPPWQISTNKTQWDAVIAEV